MILHRLGLINKNQRGFTLIELLIAVAITGAIVGGITSAIFQVFSVNTRSNNHMTAIRQVQSAGYWVSHDTQMAQSVVTEGLVSPKILDLEWIEWADNITHTANYTLAADNRLRRGHVIYDTTGTITANQTDIIAHHIITPPTSCNFTDYELIFTVTAAIGEASETREYKITPRPSPQ